MKRTMLAAMPPLLVLVIVLLLWEGVVAAWKLPA